MHAHGLPATGPHTCMHDAHHEEARSPANLSACVQPLCDQVCESFTVNDQPHYQFNPRDITEWVKGLTR
jgi:hypothetical protein